METRTMKRQPKRSDLAAEAEGFIERWDGFRRSPSRLGAWSPYKEWQHFLLHGVDRASGDKIQLIVNFNLLDNVWQRELGVETARLIVLAKTDRWRGLTERFAAWEVAVQSGSIDARFGDHELNWREGAYAVHIAPREQFEIDLSFRPLALPGLALQQPLAPDLRLSWLFVPRLQASGRVRAGDTVFEIVDAAAYHDHNWASFRWGDDFVWEWASILPEEPDCPWTLVLMRLLNRARTRVRSQALFVWCEGRPYRTFRDDEIEVDSEGRFAMREAAFITPPVMGMLATGRCGDVPKRWELRASSREDSSESLRLSFQPEGVSQVVMPNEVDLEGVSTLNEATGSVLVDGRLDGQDVQFRGLGVFEFLRT